MNSKFQSYWKNPSLPISLTETTKSTTTDRNEQQQEEDQAAAAAAAAGGGLRRRLSSLSMKIQPIISSVGSSSSSWSSSFRRSKSLPAIGGEYGGSSGSSIRNWWDWGWAWILSRKPIFARDLEMNQEESTALGCHNKGSWRHVLYKLRSELKRLVRSDNVGLPQTFRYDSFNYSKNFDDGRKTPLG